MKHTAGLMMVCLGLFCIAVPCGAATFEKVSVSYRVERDNIFLHRTPKSRRL